VIALSVPPVDGIGEEVVDVVVVMRKVGGENALEGSGREVKTLIDVRVEDGEVVVVDENGDGEERSATAT
jgi:adenine phosphoribosyltransferase